MNSSIVAVCFSLLLVLVTLSQASIFKWSFKPFTAEQDMPSTLSGGVPKRIHQSWKTNQIPKEKFNDWPHSWQSLHSTWQYKLWTDESNRKLVVKYYPMFLKTYDGLPTNIMRADYARLFYMHKYGGVYADLDNEALQPMDMLLDNCSTAVLARMGDNASFEHSIPNAWMASVPNHPFWIFTALMVQDRFNNGTFTRPEWISGPVVLYTAYNMWQQLTNMTGAPGTPVQLLDEGLIFPINWNKAGSMSDCVPKQPNFNTTKCKERFPDAHMISYWTHSWGRRL